MIQQINLYQTGLHESRVPFSARQMAGAVAALFFVLIAAGAVSHWRQTGLAGELSRLQKRHDEALRRIDEYQQKYPPRSPDPELVRQVEAMTQARQASLELLRRINESQLGNRRGIAACQAVSSKFLLIETDTPDLMPVSASGPVNEPANLVLICGRVAEIRNTSPDEIARITGANAVALLGLP